MRLAEIHRYPVKSMLGERLSAARLEPGGLPGDRVWALRDEVRGEITGAKKHPNLMGLAAGLVSEPDPATPSPEVRIGDGAGLDTSSARADVHERLSEVLGHRVSLWPLLPAERLDHYRRATATGAAGANALAGLRALFARAEDEPLPDLGVLPEVLAHHATPPGTYFDAFPLLIMTRSSLNALAAGAAADGIEARFDLRRFRPNLVLDGAGEGFAENDWSGRRLRIGDAEVTVHAPCPRCIMTTHGFLDVPRDPRIMRALVRHNGGNLGVYGSVTRPGGIAAGDPVTLL